DRGADGPAVFLRGPLPRHRVHIRRRVVRHPPHGCGRAGAVPRLDPVFARALHAAARRSDLVPPDGSKRQQTGTRDTFTWTGHVTGLVAAAGTPVCRSGWGVREPPR